jgi:hypothetical protein
MWLNSLGHFETFSFLGKSSFTSGITETEVNRQKSVGFGNAIDTLEKKSTNVQEQVTIHVHSGYQTKTVIDALRDFLVSDFRYEDINGKFMPIRIVPASFKIFDDGQDNWSLEFDYLYPLTNKYYTPWSMLG